MLKVRSNRGTMINEGMLVWVPPWIEKVELYQFLKLLGGKLYGKKIIDVVIKYVNDSPTWKCFQVNVPKSVFPTVMVALQLKRSCQGQGWLTPSNRCVPSQVLCLSIYKVYLSKL